MKKSRGSSLAQYGIIIALVAIAVVPVYFTFGQHINSAFEHFNNFMQVNNIQVSLNALDNNLISNGKVLAGQMGGTPANPVRKCVGDFCALDYGTIILNKVPSKLDNAVETSGSAGLTEEVLGLVDQVAAQLENNPEVTPEQLTKIKTLIAYGKDIVNIEKNFEKIFPQAKEYSLQANSQMQTLQSQLNNKQITQAEYNQQLTSISGTLMNNLRSLEIQQTQNDKLTLSTGNKIATGYSQMSFLLNPNTVVGFTANGYGATTKGTAPSYEDFLNGKLLLPPKDASSVNANATSVQRSPVGEYLTLVKELTDDKTLDPAAQEITRILSKEIYQVSQTVSDKSNLIRNNAMFNFNIGNNNVETILNKAPSETTRLDLSIICSSNRASYNFDNDQCN